MHTAADSLLHWLLRTSLEASILILAVLGLRLMLGTRLSPAWRIGLWMLVGAKLMLPAFIPAGFGLGGWLQNEEVSAISQPAVIFNTSSPSVYSVPSVVENSSPDTVRHSSSFDIRHSALAVWLLGSFTVLGIAFIQQARFNALLRRRPRATASYLRALIASLAQKTGIKQPVSIVLMPAGTTPAMVSIRQPKLLLPEDWDTRFDERSLRHVMLHELLHVKQHTTSSGTGPPSPCRRCIGSIRSCGSSSRASRLTANCAATPERWTFSRHRSASTTGIRSSAFRKPFSHHRPLQGWLHVCATTPPCVNASS